MPLRRLGVLAVVAIACAALYLSSLIGVLSLVMPRDSGTIRHAFIAHLSPSFRLAFIVDALVAGLAIAKVVVENQSHHLRVTVAFWRVVMILGVGVPALLGVLPLWGPHVTVMPRDIGGDNVVFFLVCDAGIPLCFAALLTGFIVAVTFHYRQTV